MKHHARIEYIKQELQKFINLILHRKKRGNYIKNGNNIKIENPKIIS